MVMDSRSWVEFSARSQDSLSLLSGTAELILWDVVGLEGFEPPTKGL